MKRHGVILMLGAALALAGCSERKSGEEQTEGSEPANIPTTAGTDAPSAGPAPIASQVPVADAIPEALRGRWGLVPADCTSTHGDAKGLMEVTAKTLTFYESRARLAKVRSGSADSIRADFSFSGEGQDWTLDVELRSWDGGNKLIREDRGPEALPGPLTYTRCAA